MILRKAKLKKAVVLAGVAVVAAILVAGCATAGAKPAKHAPASDRSKPATAPDPSTKTLYAMARMMRDQGKTNEQEAVLRGLIAKDPKFLPAYADLAEIRMHQKRPGEAAQELARGLEVAPQDPVLLNDLGVCALLENKPEEALGRFQAAVKASPREARYQANVALALGLLGRYDESLEAYRKVLSEADAQHNIGIIKRMRESSPGSAAGAVSAEDLKQPSPPTTEEPMPPPTEAQPEPVPGNP